MPAASASSKPINDAVDTGPDGILVVPAAGRRVLAAVAGACPLLLLAENEDDRGRACSTWPLAPSVGAAYTPSVPACDRERWGSGGCGCWCAGARATGAGAPVVHDAPWSTPAIDDAREDDELVTPGPKSKSASAARCAADWLRLPLSIDALVGVAP